MKRLILLLLLLFQNNLVSSGKNSLTIPIVEVIEKYFEAKSILFDLVIYGDDQKWCRYIITELYQRENVASASKTIAMNKSDMKGIDESAIIFFKTEESFAEFNLNVNLKRKFAKDSKLLMVFGSHEAPKIELKTWNLGLNYPTILTSCRDQKSSFCLFAAETTTKEFCRKYQTTELNRFSKRSLTWKTQSFFRGMESFHGCDLFVGVYHVFPYIYFEKFENGTSHYNGIHVKITEVLARKLNFTIQYGFYSVTRKQFSDPHFVPDFSPSTTGYQGFRPENDEILGFQFLPSTYGFIIPYGEPYTPFEKLFLPFDVDTWIWFLIFMFGGVVAICILKFVPDSNRKFIIGRDVRAPMVNLFQVFFGVGLIRLPGRNFARYLLMMFILFCLIMRTAYQGKMYEFMQKVLRKPEVQSIQELMDKNFTIYHAPGYEKVVGHFDILKG